MSTLAEIEAALPQLSAPELKKLEQTVRELERKRESRARVSLRDLKPFHGGEMLKPLGPEDDILGEMIDAKRS